MLISTIFISKRITGTKEGHVTHGTLNTYKGTSDSGLELSQIRTRYIYDKPLYKGQT
jgi:hypothetical protein